MFVFKNKYGAEQSVAFSRAVTSVKAICQSEPAVFILKAQVLNSGGRPFLCDCAHHPANNTALVCQNPLEERWPSLTNLDSEGFRHEHLKAIILRWKPSYFHLLEP